MPLVSIVLPVYNESVTLAELHLKAFLPADAAISEVLRQRVERW